MYGTEQSDLPMLQLPMSSPNIIYSSQEGLPELREVENRLNISDTRFEDIARISLVMTTTVLWRFWSIFIVSEGAIP
jgi:hypothetical protein